MMRLILLACACLWLAGCSSSSTSLSERLVAPGGVSPLLDEERIAATIATVPNRSGHVVTRDQVSIFWRAIDPGQYAMQYRYLGQRNDPAHVLDVDFSFKVPSAPPPTPRGTVVLLHGWMMDGDSLLPWSLELAQAGYRVITIDLRNHGHSGGGPSGYGTRESDDVIDVLDALQPRGEIRARCICSAFPMALPPRCSPPTNLGRASPVWWRWNPSPMPGVASATWCRTCSPVNLTAGAGKR